MLVLLDRDGVINEDSPLYVKSPEEWRPIRGSLDAIARLNRAGHTVVVCSNQSGVWRGLFGEQVLEAIHAKMRAALAARGGHLDAILYCPHAPDAGCDCRKPKPGMLRDAMARFADAATHTVFIGDSRRDVDAAIAARCTPLLVRTGQGARTETLLAARDHDSPRNAAGRERLRVFDDLAQAADWVIECGG